MSEEIHFIEKSIYCEDAILLIDELNDILMGIVGNNGTKHVNLSDFEQEGSIFFVGYYKNEPICCAGIRNVDNQTGEIKRVYTRENRLGVGSALIDQLEKWANEHQYHRLILECREVNQHAITFYKKKGYKVCDKYPPYIEQEDAVCMDKIIS